MSVKKQAHSARSALLVVECWCAHLCTPTVNNIITKNTPHQTTQVAQASFSPCHFAGIMSLCAIAHTDTLQLERGSNSKRCPTSCTTQSNKGPQTSPNVSIFLENNRFVHFPDPPKLNGQHATPCTISPGMQTSDFQQVTQGQKLKLCTRRFWPAQPPEVCRVHSWL